MYQRKINELKVDIESHYEKRLQAESKSERLQIEMDKLQKQFEMFKKILSDKTNDDERFNLMSFYQTHQQASHNHHAQGDFVKRYTNRAVEDTGSIISDYTEDDIDLPLDENNLDVCNINYGDLPLESNAENGVFHLDGMAHNVAAGPSASSLPNNNNRRSSTCGGRKRNTRHSTSLTRNGESRDKKRSRTRSTEMANREKQKEIKAITTLKIGEKGQPITVISEIQHNNQENILSQHNRIDPTGNKMELSFVPPRVKNRKKRPSREFLQRSADESQSLEDSEVFWNGSDAIAEEITSTNTNNPNFQLMTPIIEAPTPVSSRIINSNYKFTPATSQKQTPAPGSTVKPLGSQPKSLSANSVMPLARRYKKSHLFKGQVILNSEICAHCEKRTKFGKLVMKCRECELVVHTECKDQIQRPCYSTLTFTSQGKISDYCTDESPYIPSFLQIIVNEIEHRGLLSHEVGLYRVNGSDSQIKQLKERLFKRHQVLDFRKTDVHVLCSFLKDFLNNLNEHLITYDAWYRFAKICEIQNENERMTCLQEAIQDLPDANRDTLAFLILHLQRISETPECKMPVLNLARVFGPCLVGNSSANLPNAEIVNELNMQYKIVENLVKLPSAFYQSFIDGGNDINTRLFKNLSKTPEQMRKSKTAVVLSSILGPASNLPPAVLQQVQLSARK